MSSLLPVYHKLQDALVATGGNSSQAPKLPQIVVIGSQSSGKSSVLESFVGRDFLPRGAGIVTRRPLVLQLVHTPVEADRPEEWGEFLHKPGRRFTDFGEIRAEIEAETERSLGKSKKVSPEPIRLAIYSPNVVDLSLVDLPGLTKVPVADQPADIEQQIRQMSLAYIEPEVSLILAVSAANSDLATSDAIQLAKRVDPEGVRTMGVLTKIDLMDEGTDAIEILKGSVIPLKRGFVGVVNRSQRDILDGKSPTAAREAERSFFESHPRYRTMAGTMGCEHLAKRLNELLLSHLRTQLPSLTSKVHAALSSARVELAGFGDSRLEGGANMGALVLQLIHKFCTNYCEAIDGTSAHVQEASRESGELLGGAKINDIFRYQFLESMMSVDACSGLADADIARAIRQATGPRTPLFVPEGSFELLARQQIKLLRAHCLQAVELVLAELQRLLPACLPPEVLRYSVLQSRMQQCGYAALQKREAKASEMVNNLLDMELAFLNTSHPDFVGGGTAMRMVAQQLHAAADEQQYRAGMEPLETDIIRSLLVSYYGIVRKNLLDSVPKAIMHFLVNSVRQNIQEELVIELYKQDEFAEMLREADDALRRRQECVQLVASLERAQRAVDELRAIPMEGSPLDAISMPKAVN